MASIGDLLQYGRNALVQSGNEYAKYESKVLLEETTGINYMRMLLCMEEEVSQENEKRYRELIERRCKHYPLQYMLGYTHFMDYTFLVNEDVLIPRNDTEILVEAANAILKTEVKKTEDEKPDYDLLDLCCGSGCIGISLKLYNQEIEVTLCDISAKALAVTKDNLDKYGISGKILESDLFSRVSGKYNMIVSNPPYIERNEIEDLMEEVRDYEPRLALDGGEDGLDFYRKIVSQAKHYLKEEGYLIFEIGYNQGAAVTSLMEKSGFLEVVVKKDYGGLDRVVIGHL